MLMKNKVVVVGSYNVDIMIKTAHLPKRGETVLGNSICFSHGGKGANQAVAARRAEADVSFIARIGADSYGEKAICDLKKEGVCTEGITIDQNLPTGMASITVGQQGENCIVAVSGANSQLSLKDIEKRDSQIATADILLVQLETPLDTVAMAIKRAFENNTTVILDPAPAQKLKPEMLQQVTVITPNKGEAELLTGITITDEGSLIKASEMLQSFGVKVVLITLGKKGVFMSTKGHNQLIPAYPINALDSTGAGDVFNGVLAATYHEDTSSLVKAVSFAASAATLSATKLGTQTAIPYLKDIVAFIELHGNKQ
jgi:ribokinase